MRKQILINLCENLNNLQKYLHICSPIEKERVYEQITFISNKLSAEYSTEEILDHHKEKYNEINKIK